MLSPFLLKILLLMQTVVTGTGRWTLYENTIVVAILYHLCRLDQFYYRTILSCCISQYVLFWSALCCSIAEVTANDMELRVHTILVLVKGHNLILDAPVIHLTILMLGIFYIIECHFFHSFFNFLCWCHVLISYSFCSRSPTWLLELRSPFLLIEHSSLLL